MALDYTLLTIFSSGLVINLIYTVIAPFYPLIAEEKGMSNLMLGIVFTMMPVSGCLVTTKIGENLSFLGRKNTLIGGMILGVIFIQALSLIILAFISNFDIESFTVWSLISRAIGGIGMSAVYIAGFSIIANDYEKDRERNISIFEVFSGLGLMLGPAFGSICFNLLGFSGIFIASAGLLLIPVPGAFYLISNKNAIPEIEEDFKSRSLLKRKNILLDISVALYSTIVYNFFDPTLGPFLKSEGYSETAIGYVFIISTFAYTLGSFCLVFILERANKFYLMIASIFTTILGLLMIGPWEWILGSASVLPVIGMCLIAFGGSLGYVTPLPYMLDEADDLGIAEKTNIYDALSGLFNMSVSLGEIVGPLIAGIFVEVSGFANSCLVMGLLGVLLTAWYWTCRSWRYPKSMNKNAGVLLQYFPKHKLISPSSKMNEP